MFHLQAVSSNFALLMREDKAFCRVAAFCPTPYILFSTKSDQHQSLYAEDAQIPILVTPRKYGFQNSTSFTTYKAFAGMLFTSDTFLRKIENETKPG